MSYVCYVSLVTKMKWAKSPLNKVSALPDFPWVRIIYFVSLSFLLIYSLRMILVWGERPMFALFTTLLFLYYSRLPMSPDFPLQISKLWNKREFQKNIHWIHSLCIGSAYTRLVPAYSEPLFGLVYGLSSFSEVPESSLTRKRLNRFPCVSCFYRRFEILFV